MNIVFGMRPDYLTNKGGDTFQMLKTKEYLEKINNVNVRVVTSPSNLFDYKIDVLHVFNLQNCEFTYSMIKAVKKDKKVKIVLSPIIWNFGYAEEINKVMRLFHNIYIAQGLKFLSGMFEFIYTHKNRNVKKYILQNSDIILPNSDEEADILSSGYSLDFNKVIVPNCIDPVIVAEDPIDNIPNDCVLQVGRIEPTKNQISLLLAMMNHKDIPLVFIGAQNKRKQYYINQVKDLAQRRGNTFFIEEVNQSKLINYYKAAKVHVLPSFRESPGLVTLEALYYGCNVVVSDERFCPIRYYKFDRLANICNPYSIKSIEREVLKSYDKDRMNINRDYFKFFSYENAARLTYEAYLSVLDE